jgi:hypothetical protein
MELKCHIKGNIAQIKIMKIYIFKSYVFLVLTISLMHFELIFVYGMK